MNRSYLEMLTHRTYEERFEYLKLDGSVGHATFGHARWMNQSFYTSREWRTARRDAISRDNACDLGVPGFEIHTQITVHHIIPVSPEALAEGHPMLVDLNNLITTTHDTHNAIHYGDRSLLRLPPPEREMGDTKLW